MKNKKIFVSIFVILMLLILPINNVSAGTDYVEDFEDDTLTQQATDTYYGATYFETEASGVNSYVDNTYAVSGTKSYRTYRLEYSWFNFTYGATQYMTDFSMLFRWNTFANSVVNWSFYDANDILILNFKLDTQVSSGTIHWEDYNGWNHNNTVYVPNQWFWLNWTINSNDSYDFEFRRYSNGVAYQFEFGEAPVNIVNTSFPRITTLRMRCHSGASPREIHSDDIIPTFGYFEGEEEESYLPPCCPSCDEVGGLAIVGTGFEPPTSRNYFLHVYDVVEQGNLTRIDLLIHDEMATHITLSSVILKINDFYHANPSELVQLENSDFWRLSWVLSEELPSEKLYFLFKSNAMWNTLSWKLPYVTYDLNEDGKIFVINYDEGVGDAYWSTFSSSYTNLPSTAYPSILYSGYELVMRLCIDRASGEVGLQNFTTNIFVEPTSGCTNETYFITYFINQSSMLYEKRNITVDNGTANYTFNLLTQDGTVGFTPREQGTYYINLTINDVVVDGVTLTINCYKNNFVFTEPNPSLPLQTFRIYYDYTYPTYYARIYIPATGEEWQIPPSSPLSSGYKETKISYSGTYEILLQQWNNDTYQYIPIDSYNHYVSGTFADSIKIYPTNIEADEYTTISGYHNHIGRDVYVLSNGNIIPVSVSDSSSFKFNYYPEASGIYEIKLVLIHDGSQILLAQASDLIVGGDAPTPEDEDFFDTVLGEQKVWLGIGIIIAFLFMPFGLSIKTGLDAPIILYIAMGALGTAVATLSFNLVDKSYLLVMCIGLVAGAIMTIVKTKL